LTVALVLGGGFGLFALSYVTFTLWPRWPGPMVAGDVPAIPVTVAGVTFNVPPAAIRVPLQRRPGAQARLDLAFLWPTLTPPHPVKPDLTEDPKAPDQLFVSIADVAGTLSLQERIKTIYPRYVEASAFSGPEGLVGVAFRDGTPYQGEDLFFEADRPENFIVRCTRPASITPGTCLYERRMQTADVVVRFPRDWLGSWASLTQGFDRLLASLRPASG
jgi:hypothetical protein